MNLKKWKGIYKQICWDRTLVLWKKNLPGRGLTEVQKHCSSVSTMHISVKTDGNRNTDITHDPPVPSPYTLFHIIYYLFHNIYPLLRFPSSLLFVPAHSMKAHTDNRGTAPFIHYPDTRWRWVVSFTPRPLYLCGKNSGTPSQHEAGWTQQLVWTFRRGIELQFLNPLTPNDPYSGRTATLTSKRCILYIYSTNIATEYFKHGIHSPFFPS